MNLINFSNWLVQENISQVLVFLFVFLIIPLIYYFLMWAILSTFGKKNSIKRFILDKVALFWPFHHLALTIMIFIVSIKSELIMKINFKEMGYQYIGLFTTNNQWILNSLCIIAIISSVYYLYESRARLSRNHNRSSWLTEVEIINWFQGLFASFVCFLLIISAGFIFSQWINLFLFFHSDWAPTNILSSDMLFNTGWIRDILISEFVLIVLISFNPLVLSIREKNFGSTKHYTRTFIVAIITIFLVIAMLLYSYNHFLSQTKEEILNGIIYEINSGNQSSFSISHYYKSALLIHNYEQIIQYSDSVKLPTWLEGIFGVRLLILIIDIFNHSTNEKMKLLDAVRDKIKDYFK